MNFPFGFTLTELLIVVTILGILASIAIPRFFPQAEKSRVSEAVGILSAIRQGEEAYRLERGVYLDNPNSDLTWAQLGIQTPAGKYFTYTVSATTGPPPIFTAKATRNNVRDANNYVNSYVTLDNTGTYGGDHQFVPTG